MYRLVVDIPRDVINSSKLGNNLESPTSYTSTCTLVENLKKDALETSTF